MHPQNTMDYFSHCWEVCEVIASHDCHKLEGLGKTISVDETFLTHRIYNREKIAKSTTATFLGIY